MSYNSGGTHDDPSWASLSSALLPSADTMTPSPPPPQKPMSSDRTCHGVQQMTKAPRIIVIVLNAFLARFSFFFCCFRRRRSLSVRPFPARLPRPTIRFQNAEAVMCGTAVVPPAAVAAADEAANRGDDSNPPPDGADAGTPMWAARTMAAAVECIPVAFWCWQKLRREPFLRDPWSCISWAALSVVSLVQLDDGSTVPPSDDDWTTDIPPTTVPHSLPLPATTMFPVDRLIAADKSDDGVHSASGAFAIAPSSSSLQCCGGTGSASRCRIVRACGHSLPRGRLLGASARDLCPLPCGFLAASGQVAYFLRRRDGHDGAWSIDNTGNSASALFLGALWTLTASVRSASAISGRPSVDCTQVSPLAKPSSLFDKFSPLAVVVETPSCSFLALSPLVSPLASAMAWWGNQSGARSTRWGAQPPPPPDTSEMCLGCCCCCCCSCCWWSCVSHHGTRLAICLCRKPTAESTASGCCCWWWRRHCLASDANPDDESLELDDPASTSGSFESRAPAAAMLWLRQRCWPHLRVTSSVICWACMRFVQQLTRFVKLFVGSLGRRETLCPFNGAFDNVTIITFTPLIFFSRFILD